MSTETPTRGRDAVVAFLQRRWLSLVLVALALVFVLQNRHEVQIELLVTTVRTPMWVALVVMLVVGLAAGTFRIRRAGSAPRRGR